MSNQQAAPGSPVGRKMTDTTTPPGAPQRKERPRGLQRNRGARNLFSLKLDGVAPTRSAPGGRRRRKSKRKSHKKSHKKKHRTKRRRKSRKKKSKRRRRR